jgi:hypothetical protein
MRSCIWHVLRLVQRSIYDKQMSHEYIKDQPSTYYVRIPLQFVGIASESVLNATYTRTLSICPSILHTPQQLYRYDANLSKVHLASRYGETSWSAPRALVVSINPLQKPLRMVFKEAAENGTTQEVDRISLLTSLNPPSCMMCITGDNQWKTKDIAGRRPDSATSHVLKRHCTAHFILKPPLQQPLPLVSLTWYSC